MKPSLLHPRHPERVCWGCHKFCTARDLACGNGKDRVQHPVEVLGDDWQDAFPDLVAKAANDEASPRARDEAEATPAPDVD